MTSVLGQDRLLLLERERVISVWEGGDPNGVPVIFHHGSPASRLHARHGHGAAERHGVRLISFNRPGYGDSTETPPSLASVGGDTLAVADHLQINDFLVVGASGGGPYALATGIADPGRVRAVGVVAGIGPWRLIEPALEADPERLLLALADAGDVSAAVAGFRRQAATEFDHLLSLDDGEMVSTYFDGAPADDIRWLDLAASRVWAADLRDALRTYDGYARDNVAWGGQWDVDLSQLVSPTWLWYGDKDRIVPVEHGLWLAAAIPHATLAIRSGKGHGGTSFEFWDDTFAALRSAHVTRG